MERGEGECSKDLNIMLMVHSGRLPNQELPQFTHGLSPKTTQTEKMCCKFCQINGTLQNPIAVLQKPLKFRIFEVSALSDVWYSTPHQSLIFHWIALTFDLNIQVTLRKHVFT